MSNAQYGAPSAEVQGSFTAPEHFTNNKVKLATEPIPQGLHMATIFGVVSLGTHMESFNGGQPSPKNKIFIAFELPQHKRKFYEDDDEMRSSAIFNEMTFAAYTDKARLRKIIEAACQRKVTDDEARAFDCSKLLGCSVMINIVHYTKRDGTQGEKAESYASIVGMPVPIGYQPTNDYWLFYLDQQMNNFRSTLFANLPNFLKEKLIESQEGQKFIASGGLFAKVEQQQEQQQRATAPAPQTPAQGGKQVEMLVNDFTYDQYIGNKWTDQMLVDNGKAKWINATPPAPQAPPVAPATPQAPTPPPVQAQQQPQYVPPAVPQQQYAAPVQQQYAPPIQPQAPQVPPTPAQSFLDEEDDMPF